MEYILNGTMPSGYLDTCLWVLFEKWWVQHDTCLICDTCLNFTTVREIDSINDWKAPLDLIIFNLLLGKRKWSLTSSHVEWKVSNDSQHGNWDIKVNNGPTWELHFRGVRRIKDIVSKNEFIKVGKRTRLQAIFGGNLINDGYSSMSR